MCFDPRLLAHGLPARVQIKRDKGQAGWPRPAKNKCGRGQHIRASPRRRYRGLPVRKSESASEYRRGSVSLRFAFGQNVAFCAEFCALGRSGALWSPLLVPSRRRCRVASTSPLASVMRTSQAVSAVIRVLADAPRLAASRREAGAAAKRLRPTRTIGVPHMH